MSNPFDVIRSYLNDRQGDVFTDEVLAPFAAEAVAMTPRIAAGLVALSRGAFDLSDRLLRIDLDKQKEEVPNDNAGS